MAKKTRLIDTLQEEELQDVKEEQEKEGTDSFDYFFDCIFSTKRTIKDSGY